MPTNETRLTAALPRLDVDIVRRRDEDLSAETMTIRLRATPSFGALAGHLAVPFVASPFMWWTEWLAMAWRPWLTALSPPPGRDATADD